MGMRVLSLVGWLTGMMVKVGRLVGVGVGVVCSNTAFRDLDDFLRVVDK